MTALLAVVATRAAEADQPAPSVAQAAPEPPPEPAPPPNLPPQILPPEIPPPQTPPPLDTPPAPERQPAAAPTAAPSAAAPTAQAPSEAPPPDADSSLDGMAGYRNGLFYIRSRDNVFRLYSQGRVHVDHYAWFGPGVASLTPDQALKSGFILRRARFELAGEFFQMWQWQLGADFAPSAADNAGANTGTLSCKPDPTTLALTCSNRESTVEAPSVKPAPTDAFINFAPSPWANVQVGQFYLPFTMENRISDNTSPFLERSMAVRGIGAPLQRDIGAMVWGESPDRSIYYAVGVFNGDGPNRPNADGRYDVAGRVMARPLMTTTTGPSRWAQVGASVHGGSRDPRQVGYDMASLTTQEGYAFWKPTYTDSQNRLVHIIPSGTQWALSGDVYAPIGNFDLTAEVVYADYNTREAFDGAQLSNQSARFGEFKGLGYYAEAGYWLVGNHDIFGHPTYQRPLHLDLSVKQNPPQHGLQVLGRFEQLALTYSGESRGGGADSKTPDGNINVFSFTLGVNYWATRHLRVSVNYGYYVFPGSAPLTASETGGPVQTSSQRAVAPAQLLTKGVDSSARDGGHDVHEVSARFGVQF